MGYTVIKNQKRTCIKCATVLPLSEFYSYQYTTKQGKVSTRYDSRCKNCNSERRKERYKKQRDKERSLNREWSLENAERLVEYRKEYQSLPSTKRKKAAAQRRRKALMRSGCPEEGDKIKILYDMALQLEASTGQKYHVDHIIPLSRGGKHELSNLQIIPEVDNLRKGTAMYCLIDGVRLSG